MSPTLIAWALAIIVVIVLPVRGWAMSTGRLGRPAQAIRWVETLGLTTLLMAILVEFEVPLEAVGLGWPGIPRFLFGLIGGLVIVVGPDVIGLALMLRRGPVGEGQRELVSQVPTGRAAMLFLPFLLLSATWEELCFRAVMVMLSPEGAGAAAAWCGLGCLVFALNHLGAGPRGACYAGWYGLLFLCVYLAAGSLIAVIMVHAAGNAFVAVYTGPRLRRRFLTHRGAPDGAASDEDGGGSSAPNRVRMHQGPPEVTFP